MLTNYFGPSSAEFRSLADAVLIVQEHQLPVHKAILAANSSTFTRIFASCSGSTEDKTKMKVPLDDSLLAVCTTLKFLYDGCTTLNASQLEAVDDAYHVAHFAHKYDMRALLNQCEIFLLRQVPTPSKLFSGPGAAVKWTLLAEKCEMSIFLAHCELFMAKKTDELFWSFPAENAMHLSSNSLLRMLKVASWKNRCGRDADLVQMIKWQGPTGNDASDFESSDVKDDSDDDAFRGLRGLSD